MLRNDRYILPIFTILKSKDLLVSFNYKSEYEGSWLQEAHRSCQDSMLLTLHGGTMTTYNPFLIDAGAAHVTFSLG